MADLATCSAPGCSEPGTNKCGSCKITLYCCVACQTIDWPSHKEECQGHLRKLGEANIQKARGFEAEHNWIQSLRFSELALTKLDKLKDRTLDVIKIIDEAMTIKYNALNFTNQKKEALECAKKRYSMWAAGYMRNPGMYRAAFPLIEGLLFNNEYEQASKIAHTAYEMIMNDTDGIIPADQRQQLIAHGSSLLSQATQQMAESGGIPPEEMQKVGEEAIALARKALEIDTQLYGAESSQAANDMMVLTRAMDFFNDADDDEVLRLVEQAIASKGREYGRSSLHVAICENNLGHAYFKRAKRAQAANDLDRELANLELALPHHREAARIYRDINCVDQADEAAQRVVIVEEDIVLVRIAKMQLSNTAVAGTEG